MSYHVKGMYEPGIDSHVWPSFVEYARLRACRGLKTHTRGLPSAEEKMFNLKRRGLVFLPLGFFTLAKLMFDTSGPSSMGTTP